MIYSQLGAEETGCAGVGETLSQLGRSQEVLLSPSRMGCSVSLSYQAKEESCYFYFTKRDFPAKWMLSVIKCLFIIPGFSLLAY